MPWVGWGCLTCLVLIDLRHACQTHPLLCIDRDTSLASPTCILDHFQSTHVPLPQIAGLPKAPYLLLKSRGGRGYTGGSIRGFHGAFGSRAPRKCSSYFSPCSDKILNKGLLKERRVCFGSPCESASLHGEKPWQQEWKQLVPLHP